MYKDSVSFVVLVDGRPVTEYTHPQTRETWIEGRKGSEFKIRVQNNTGRRVEAVVSVDGLSVVDGQPAGEQSRGYIIPAYGNVVIDGFRRSLDEVAAFFFGDAKKGEAYAQQMNQGGNVGVIGLAVFPEKPKPQIVGYRKGFLGGRGLESEPMRSFNADSLLRGGSKGIGRPEVTQDVGVGYGRQVESRVSEVEFTREDRVRPATTLAIRYDSLTNLRDRGVIPDTRPVTGDPNPFPAAGPAFCQDPPGYKG